MKKNDYKRIVRRIENEGFLCIDNRIKPNTNNYDEFNEEDTIAINDAIGPNAIGPNALNSGSIGTFEVGKIMEMSGSLICPGEIVSIMNYEEFDKYKNEIKYYRPVLKGKKVRFYKHSFYQAQEAEQHQAEQHQAEQHQAEQHQAEQHQAEQHQAEQSQAEEAGVIMSGESIIYPPDKEIPMTDSEIREQVNYDLMEPNKCYYATITVPDKKVILTYITSIKQPKLELPDLNYDFVFTHHIKLHECKDNNAFEIFKQSKEENGIVFYRNDGQPFEFWTPMYSDIKSQEKHYSISTNEYYIMLLNKYPLGNTYERFFEDLHYDVDIYLQHYPEHAKIFSYLRKKLDAYAALELHNNNNNNDLDKHKINRLTILLNLDKEYDADPKVVINVITY